LLTRPRFFLWFAAIAYFISRRGAQSVVVERHEVAGAASGKSGGFLALDWCHGSALTGARLLAQLAPRRSRAANQPLIMTPGLTIEKRARIRL
jgi:glycine/D-amino acid oxidase-like deaminating enzyme